MGKDLYVNEDIKAPTIIMLDEDGNKIGKFRRKEAFQKAYEEEKDLIQVHYDYKKKISTVKLMEYGKYKYQQQKKRKRKKKNRKKGTKTIKIGYNIWDHDLKVKKKKIRGLLQDNYSVKIIWQLRGRENIYKDKMKEKIKKIVSDLEDVWKSRGIKEENNGYSVYLHSKS